MRILQHSYSLVPCLSRAHKYTSLEPHPPPPTSHLPPPTPHLSCLKFVQSTLLQFTCLYMCAYNIHSHMCWRYSQPVHSHQCWSLEILSTVLVILSALYTLTTAGTWRYSQLCWLYSQPCILSPLLEPGDTLNCFGYSVYFQPCILSPVLEPGDTLNCVGYTLSPVYSHHCWSLEILSTVLVIVFTFSPVYSHQCWNLEILSTVLVILSALYTLTIAGAWRYSQLCWL